MTDQMTKLQEATSLQLLTVREVLDESLYKFDFYQRDFQWEKEHVLRMIDDLQESFLREYRTNSRHQDTTRYSPYFMGNLIIIEKKDEKFIIDGQQRLTTLTLILLYLRNVRLRETSGKNVIWESLIYSENEEQGSFNLNDPERINFMEAIYNGKDLDTSKMTQSAANMNDRYKDIRYNWPDKLSGQTLPHFITWLTSHVYFVVITTKREIDAYSIFDTINNRGLSLKQPDFLKSYLLSKIHDPEMKEIATKKWKGLTSQLNEIERDLETKCIKAWLSSQYAESIRIGRSKRPKDYERIESEFHLWLKDSHESLSISSSDDFFNLIDRDFAFYAQQFMKILNASKTLSLGLEHVHYVSQLGMTIHFMVLLAPLKPTEQIHQIEEKLRITAKFVENYFVRRIWNDKGIRINSDLKENLFKIMKDIRNLDLQQMVNYFKEFLKNTNLNFNASQKFPMTGENNFNKQRILARLTNFVQIEAELGSIYNSLVRAEGDKFEVEHIWHDDFKAFKKEVSNESEFASFRNCLGGLILLPKSVNASVGAASYEDKLDDYYDKSNNLLARSLHSSCYQTAAMKVLKEKTELPFNPFSKFGCDEIQQRCELYCKIAQKIWDPNDLMK